MSRASKRCHGRALGVSAAAMACGLVAGAGVPAPASAKDDQIIFIVDGRVEDKVEIIKETVDEVRYRGAGGAKTVASREVLRIVHGEPPTAFGRGESALAAGQYSTAAAAFQAAVSEGGAEWVVPYALYYRGESLRRWGAATQDGGRLREAIEAYDRVLADHKDHFLRPAALYGLGDATLNLGDAAKARAAFEEVAQRKHGDYWELWGKLGKGLCAYADKNYLDARQEFETTLATAKTRQGFGELAARAQVAIGEALMAGKDFDAAIRHYEEMAARGEGQGAQAVGAAYVNLAKAYLQRGKPDDKRKALRTYLAVTIYYAGAPEAYAEALYEAGKLYEAEGKKAEGEALHRELKARCPDSPFAKKVR